MIRRYIINSASGVVGALLLAGLMVVSTPLLIRYLGELQYGLYRLAFHSIVAYVVFLDWGLSIAAKRFLGDAINGVSGESSSEVLGLLFKAYLVVLCLAAVIVSLAVLFLPKIVNCPSELVSDFRISIVCAGLYGMASVMLAPYRGVFTIFARYEMDQMLTIVMRLVLIGGSVALLSVTDLGLKGVALMALAAAASGQCLANVVVKKIYPAFRVAWSAWNPELMRRIFRFGGATVCVAIGPLVVYQSQDIFISAFMSPAAVTYFAVAAIIMTLLRTLVNAFASPFFPLASALDPATDRDKLQRLLVLGSCTALFVWCAIAVPIAVYSREIISNWVGSDFGDSSLLVWVLLIGNVGTAWQFTASHLLSARGRIRHLGTSQAVMAMGAVLGMYANFAIFQGGLAGVALAVAIPEFVRSCLFVPAYACGQYGLSFLSFLTSTSLRLISVLVIGVGTSACFRAVVVPEGVVQLGAGLVFSGLVSSVAGSLVFFSASERSEFIRRLVGGMEA